jgi:hypothetical protein
MAAWSAAALGKVKVDPQDKLTQWAIEYLKPLPLGEARNLTPC